MADKLIKHRWQKILLIVAGVLMVLVFIPALLINYYWSPILAKKIKAEVQEKSDGLYHIDYSNAELHILRGEVVLYDINLIPDTAVYRQKKQAGQAPDNLYRLHVKRLVVSHIHPFTLYFKKKLNISRITLTAPELEVSYDPLKQRDTTPKDNRTLWQKLSKSLKMIRVGEIYFNDVQFKYKNYSEGKLQVSALKEMNLKASDLLIDSTTQHDNSRLLFCSDIGIDLYNYTGKSASGNYTYKLKSAKVSTRTQTLNIEGLDVKPVNPKMFFDDSKDDRFTVHLDSVQINNFDVVAIQKLKEINSSRITVSGGSFSVYSNPRHIVKKTDRVITFPQMGLKKFKSKISLDTLVIKHLDVYYNQLNTKNGQKGYVAFTNTTGRFLNITNDPAKLKKNNIARTALISYFMGKGKLDLKFNFNLTDPQVSYDYQGHMGAFDMTRVNPATMPLAMVKITSGKVNSFDFNIKSTSKVSTGKVTLLYNNLKINLLKKDTVKIYKKKGLASFFVNALIIKHDNPDDGDAVPRTANVKFERPSNFPFFKTVWQTLLSGIKPCAGVGRAKEQEALKEMDEHEKKVKEKALKKAKKEKEKAAKARKKMQEKSKSER